MKNKKMIISFFLLMILLLCVQIVGTKKFKEGQVHSLELPVGSKVPTVSQFFKNKKRKGTVTLYYKDWLVETDILNEVGTYQAVITVSNKEYRSSVTIIDKEEPTLELKNLTIAFGDTYEPSSFVTSCKDNSNRKCKFSFEKDSMQNYTEQGTYDIAVVATDESSNKTVKKAKLTIKDGVSTQIEEILENGIDVKLEETFQEEYKYGVKITQKESVYYEVDQDGNQKRIMSKKDNQIDRETYQADTNDLLNEAKQILKEQKQEIEGILNNINEIRNHEKLSKLNLSDKLSEAATIRALEIAWSGHYSHTRPNGMSCYTISKDLGWNIKILGENIAKGMKNSNDVVSYWKDSLGNYKNLVNPKYQYIGIGVVEVDNVHYWTVLFSNQEA